MTVTHSSVNLETPQLIHGLPALALVVDGDGKSVIAGYAGLTAQMATKFGREGVERALDERHDPTRMSTGTSSFDRGAQLMQSTQIATQGPAFGEQFERVGDRREPELAGATLSG